MEDGKDCVENVDANGGEGLCEAGYCRADRHVCYGRGRRDVKLKWKLNVVVL